MQKPGISISCFLMNVGEDDICWKMPEKNGSEKTTIMKKNIIFFNPAGVVFSRNTEDRHEFLSVFVEPKKMISSAKIFFEKNVDFKEMYDIDDPHLEHILKLLLSEVRSENKNGSLFMENLTTLLSLHFLKNYAVSNSNLTDNIGGLTKMEYEKILVYVDRNLTEDLRLDHLAKEMVMDKFQLIRKFKSFAKITPYQFIMQKRLEHSRHLLKDPGHSLTEIAYMLNFSDQSHFSNSFAKMYGVTPDKFRKTDDKKHIRKKRHITSARR